MFVGRARRGAGRRGLSNRRDLDIAAHGLRAAAAIASVRPTGRIPDGNPELPVSLLVSRPGGSSYEAYEVAVQRLFPARLIGCLQSRPLVTVSSLPDAGNEVVPGCPPNLRT
ncbi:hypothetical protein B7755_017165 [Streptomyces sp. NBS 14/10]|uniref:hypothetical protein n=1 Tax=Streptomyces sp. NBS 14/10 TaxID=1945643 RepID=UPI000B7C7706|nr:hypothetical protein [Streptomyces sp. NBS 14/10]KAK1179721.1 hypothetical protein B7755_017165 [Streptomyces sp. NBS 14/10]